PRSLPGPRPPTTSITGASSDLHPNRIMAETSTKKGRADDDTPTRDYPTPDGPPQDADWEREAKPELSKEERTQGLPPETLREMMRDMLLGRRFEEKAAEAYALGKIGGF